MRGCCAGRVVGAVQLSSLRLEAGVWNRMDTGQSRRRKRKEWEKPEFSLAFCQRRCRVLPVL